MAAVSVATKARWVPLLIQGVGVGAGTGAGVGGWIIDNFVAILEWTNVGVILAFVMNYVFNSQCVRLRFAVVDGAEDDLASK